MIAAKDVCLCPHNAEHGRVRRTIFSETNKKGLNPVLQDQPFYLLVPGTRLELVHALRHKGF